MKPNLKNPYGYKVCFKRSRDKPPEYMFLTYTYKQAVEMKKYYYRYPPPDDDGNKIISKWYILPITKKEMKSGIWQQAPF